MLSTADLALYDPSSEREAHRWLRDSAAGRLTAIDEVKNKLGTSPEWAAQTRRNLLSLTAELIASEENVRWLRQQGWDWLGVSREAKPSRQRRCRPAAATASSLSRRTVCMFGRVLALTGEGTGRCRRSTAWRWSRGSRARLRPSISAQAAARGGRRGGRGLPAAHQPRGVGRGTRPAHVLGADRGGGHLPFAEVGTCARSGISSTGVCPRTFVAVLAYHAVRCGRGYCIELAVAGTAWRTGCG